MIEIRNLYKRYHNHHGSDWVLKDINVTIPQGVSVGLIGANGAGKSTLLRLIAGMDTPERGEVIRHSRVSWPVGLSGGMQNNMTGRQNVKFVARVQGSGAKEVKRIIKFVEDFAEIGLAFDEPIRTYSSGMKSRLSFGLSLAFDFDVYISDEATAVGDRAFKAKATRLFKEKVGKSSLIIVSHSEGILRDLCEAAIYVKNGEATWFDKLADGIDAYHHDSGVELADDKKVKNSAREGSIHRVTKNVDNEHVKKTADEKSTVISKGKNVDNSIRSKIRPHKNKSIKRKVSKSSVNEVAAKQPCNRQRNESRENKSLLDKKSAKNSCEKISVKRNASKKKNVKELSSKRRKSIDRNDTERLKD